VSADYVTVAKRARVALHTVPMPGRELLRELCREALELAPDDQQEVWRAYIRALSGDHKLRFKSVPVQIISVDGVDAALVADIESAFEEEQQ
jgi:hypothetical protein